MHANASRPAQSLAISPCTPQDGPALVDLWSRTGLTAAYNDPLQDFAFALGKSNSDVLVGRCDAKVVTSVMVGHDGHRGWLYYVAVDPDHQRRGYGDAIVEAGERWLAERGVRKVMLLVRETNTAVVDFYERLDYEAVPRVIMQKWLTPSKT